MTLTELRDPEAARDWLAAGLALIRVGEVGPDAVREGTPWIRAAAEDAPGLPPVGVIVDFGRLLLTPGARIRARTDGPLAGVLRSYEDQVLGRIATDPHREALSDGLRGLPHALWPAAVGLFVEQVCARVGFDARVAVEPGALRDLDGWTGAEWVVRSASAVRGSASPALESSYLALIAAFQGTARPIEPADVAVIAQLDVLRTRSARLALTQVIDASHALSAGLPRRARPTRRRDGHVSTRLDDESAYPVGGFSAISTSGSPENLVTSELALMEDDGELDLFDVRYAEGELLYYTRDEAVFVRGRRRVTLALAADLGGARFREPGLPWQRLVLVLGAVRALVDNLTTWLNHAALHVRVALPPHGLDDEERLLARALAPWIEAGTVELATVEASALPALLLADARTAPTDLVRFACEPGAPSVRDVWTAELIASPIPALRRAFGEPEELPTEPFAAWRAAVQRLLLDLV